MDVHQTLKNPLVDSTPEYKIIIVGDSNVGKSSLISSYFDQPFDEETVQTMAPCYSSKEVQRSDGTLISLQIWDTAGQERFHSINTAYFRECSVALICYNPLQSTAKQSCIYWANQIIRETQNVSLILCLMKKDLYQDKVEEYLSIGETIAQEINALKVVALSSKLQSGVTEAFQSAADAIEINGQRMLKRGNDLSEDRTKDPQTKIGCCK